MPLGGRAPCDPAPQQGSVLDTVHHDPASGGIGLVRECKRLKSSSLRGRFNLNSPVGSSKMADGV